MAAFHIGLSGFAYREWVGEGLFYPPKTKAAEYLALYGSRFNSVELDGTWYRMPGKGVADQWNAATPDTFAFCGKAHRQITHMHRLKPESLEPLRFMLGRLVPLAKAGKLGPLLVQLPPNMKRDDERLTSFFESAPVDMSQIEGGPVAPIRYAVEFRHPSWRSPDVEGILREFGVAWVGVDSDGEDAEWRDTADFHYFRLRKSDYDAAAQGVWAAKFGRALAEGREVYAFCKHEDAEHPWEWADGIRAHLQSGKQVT